MSQLMRLCKGSAEESTKNLLTAYAHGLRYRQRNTTATPADRRRANANGAAMSDDKTVPTAIGAMPPEIRKARFQQAVRDRLLELGLTQADLSRLTGIGRDSISVYCRGRSIAGPRHLDAIARALKCQPGDLLPGAEQRDKPADAAQALQVTMSSPGRYWIKLNREVSQDTMMKVMAAIAAEDAAGK